MMAAHREIKSLLHLIKKTLTYLLTYCECIAATDVTVYGVCDSDTIHHSPTRSRSKWSKLIYSTRHRFLPRVQSHRYNSLVNRATISWHHVLLMLCLTGADCSLPVRGDRIFSDRRQLSGPVGRLDGTRRAALSLVIGRRCARRTRADWSTTSRRTPSTPKGRSLRAFRVGQANYFYRSSSSLLIWSSPVTDAA